MFWAANKITTADGKDVYNFTYTFEHLYVPYWATAIVATEQVDLKNKWCFDWTLADDKRGGSDITTAEVYFSNKEAFGNDTTKIKTGAINTDKKVCVE
jgi:hypothetical protein